MRYRKNIVYNYSVTFKPKKLYYNSYENQLFYSFMNIETHIEKILHQSIQSKTDYSTGLNSVYKIVLSDNSKVFVKYQKQANDLLLKEAKELQLLGKFVQVPRVIHADEYSLILSFIEKATPINWADVGKQLAYLHNQESSYFGFEFDNKIGTTPQYNATSKKIDNWAEFYWHYRLKPQIELAHKNNYLAKELYKALNQIVSNLPIWLPNSIKPVLLHGDLWSGNVLGSKDSTYFIDPACYYGHSESDLALANMFGGFGNDFFQIYFKTHPKQPDFEKRQYLYQLYHYLNHTNLFGTGYLSGVNNCVAGILKN